MQSDSAEDETEKAGPAVADQIAEKTLPESSGNNATEEPEPSPLSRKDNVAAAEQGDPNAQNLLAISYLNGREGYEEDDEKAAYWFHLAAENGSVDAQNNLGLLYINGQGVEKDLTEAAFWLQRAAEAGNVAAQSNLGLMFYYGEGVEKDYQQSAFWLLKAAKQGYVTAQNNLALMYSDGLGVEKNQERAIYWLQKAADQGDATARKNLAMMIIEQPESVTSNLSQSKTNDSDLFSSSTEENGETPTELSQQAKPDLEARQAAKEHFNNGNQFAKAGLFDSAIPEYKKALALDPGNSNTYENLAISYAKTGSFPDAVQTMQAAIRLNPDNSIKYSTLGIIYHADQKLQRALEQYIRSVQLNPGFGEMYYNMAVIYNEFDNLGSSYRAAAQAQILGYKGSSQLLLELKKNGPDISNISAEKNSTLHLRHIVSSSAEEAEYVLGRLREGEDFSQLAAQFSLQPFNLNGGYIGPFAPNELMEEIAAVVVPLTPLAFSPLIATSTGFHIFQKFMVDADLLEPQ